MEIKIKKLLLILLLNFSFAQEEILLDRVSAVVEGKIVLLSDIVLAANAIAAQQLGDEIEFIRQPDGSYVSHTKPAEARLS